jgi:hypothetical protein
MGQSLPNTKLSLLDVFSVPGKLFEGMEELIPAFETDPLIVEPLETPLPCPTVTFELLPFPCPKSGSIEELCARAGTFFASASSFVKNASLMA